MGGILALFTFFIFLDLVVTGWFEFGAGLSADDIYVICTKFIVLSVFPCGLRFRVFFYACVVSHIHSTFFLMVVYLYSSHKRSTRFSTFFTSVVGG